MYPSILLFLSLLFLTRLVFSLPTLERQYYSTAESDPALQAAMAAMAEQAMQNSAEQSMMKEIDLPKEDQSDSGGIKHHKRQDKIGSVADGYRQAQQEMFEQQMKLQNEMQQQTTEEEFSRRR